MKILALDFDGVLVDSKLEIFMVGFNSYLKYFTKTALLDGQELTFDNVHDVCKKFKGTCDRYWELVRFTSRGADYGSIFKAIDDKVNLGSNEAFLNFKHALQEGVLEDLAAGFYLERHRLQLLDKKKWLSLMAPFQKILGIIGNVKDKCTIVLVSNKNREALDILISHFEIPFPIDFIISNESGDYKVSKMATLKDKYKVDYNDIIFFDDRIRNLLDVSKLGVRCYLALWDGTDTKVEEQEASENGVGLASEQNFSDILKKELN